MFTGLIEDIGTVVRISKQGKSALLRIRSPRVAEGMQSGDSVAINGVCLTAVAFDDREFTLEAMPETMERTNLGVLVSQSKVNLERALRQGGRLGGHIVSGHVDGTGSIRAFKRDQIGTWVYIEAPGALLSQIVEKGSVALDGVSLTVVDAGAQEFSVCIIPHTKNETTLLSKRPGDRVNIECDIIGKYVASQLGAAQSGREKEDVSKIDMDFLRKNGFA